VFAQVGNRIAPIAAALALRGSSPAYIEVMDRPKSPTSSREDAAALYFCKHFWWVASARVCHFETSGKSLLTISHHVLERLRRRSGVERTPVKQRARRPVAGDPSFASTLVDEGNP
jgi:hypothetical protein